MCIPERKYFNKIKSYLCDYPLKQGLKNVISNGSDFFRYADNRIFVSYY